MLHINLVVIYCSNIENSFSFYKKLGLIFEKHRHGLGPWHYSASVKGVVFELYPVPKGSPYTNRSRIGFSVSDVESLLDSFNDHPSMIDKTVSTSQWGRKAVVIDPDGNKVELTQADEH